MASPNARSSTINSASGLETISHSDQEYERDLEKDRAWARHEGESLRESVPLEEMHASSPFHVRPRAHVDRGDYPYSREPIGPDSACVRHGS
jgi:hypothetical protein